MNSDTPIVCIHRGKKQGWYLSYVLNQAKSVNPDSEVVLIGDNPGVEKIRVETTETLENEEVHQFRSLYSHRSTVPESYEKFCWERWFYLREFMRKNHLSTALYLDSDVLLYSPMTELAACYSDLTYECGLSITGYDDHPASWAISPHASFWTIDILDEFCRFTLQTFQQGRYLDLYTQKWDWHQSRELPGGVCDMTTLYFFHQNNQERIVNLAKSHAGATFDHNINLSKNTTDEEYLMVDGINIKKVVFIDDHPHFIRANDKERMDRAHALHFQGFAKNHISRFYKGAPFEPLAGGLRVVPVPL